MSAALVSARTAAGELGVSYSTFKQWIYKGTVRTVVTGGGHHRVARSEVDRLLARRPGVEERGRPRATSPQPHGVLVALSGRNQLRGFVEEVRGDGLLVQVRLRIGDQTLTSVITRDALAELKLKRGDEAVAIIKSTEVMVGREAERRPARRRARG